MIHTSEHASFQVSRVIKIVKINVLRKRTLEKHKKTRFPAVRTFISASAVPTLESSQCRGTWRFLGCKRRAPISICQRSMSQNNNNSNNNSKPPQKKQLWCAVNFCLQCSENVVVVLVCNGFTSSCLQRFCRVPTSQDMWVRWRLYRYHGNKSCGHQMILH